MSLKVGLVLFLEFDEPATFGQLYAKIARAIDSCEGDAQAWACTEDVLERLQELYRDVQGRG